MRLRIEKTFSGFLMCLFVALPCSTYAQISYSAIAANNTSGCSERGVPPYCKSAFTGNRTAAANTAAQTVVVNPVPGNVNFSDIHSMLYPGSTSKILFHYQPWFGSSEHIDVGYNENETAVIVNQIARMIALGGYGLIVDWYGSTSPARHFHLNTTEVIAQYLSGCFSTTCPFHMAIMEDKGAFSSQCPKGKKNQTSCITKNLNRDMDYINSLFFQAEDGIRDLTVTGVQTCALPISRARRVCGCCGRRFDAAARQGRQSRSVRPQGYRGQDHSGVVGSSAKGGTEPDGNAAKDRKSVV